MNVTELPDCTPSCHSTQCAANLISVVTRGNTRQIKTYFAQCCSNAAHVSDKWGRTALHVAASCGKWEIVDWLVKEKHADYRCKDKESGWTALHRSLFYGQVMSAVYLIYVSFCLHLLIIEKNTLFICAAYSEAQCTSYKHKLLSSLKYGVNYK